MIRTRCPETGGNILALADDDDLIKFPHLVLVLGLSLPTGADDHKIDGKFIPPQFQPGAGVWAWNLGAFLSQGLGPMAIGAGVTYTGFDGINDAGYLRPDALVVSSSLTWLVWPERLGKLFLAANYNIPLATGQQLQQKPGSILQQDDDLLVELEGSDKHSLALDLGYAVWAGSFCQKRRKIMLGAMVSFPVIEGETDTEPKLGHTLSLFSTFNF